MLLTLPFLPQPKWMTYQKHLLHTCYAGGTEENVTYFTSNQVKFLFPEEGYSFSEHMHRWGKQCRTLWRLCSNPPKISRTTQSKSQSPSNNLKVAVEFPGGLAIKDFWHCHCCGSSSIPGPGTSTCHRPKKKKSGRIKKEIATKKGGVELNKIKVAASLDSHSLSDLNCYSPLPPSSLAMFPVPTIHHLLSPLQPQGLSTGPLKEVFSGLSPFHIPSLPSLFCLSFRATPAAYGGSQARGLIGGSRRPTPQPQKSGIPAVSATYTTAHGNTRSLTHWSRPGIKPASSWMLVGFAEPQGELLTSYFTYSFYLLSSSHSPAESKLHHHGYSCWVCLCCILSTQTAQTEEALNIPLL